MKRPLAVVVEELVAREGQAARTAHHGNALPLAVAARSRLRDLRAIEVEVAGDDEVELAVEVVVQPGAARVPARLRGAQARAVRGLHEAAVAFVAIQHAPAEVGDEEIGVAVVVVVGRADALAPSRARHAGLLRDVLELQPPEVAIEVAGRFRARPVAIQSRPVREEEIHPSVAVVVQRGHSAARRLEDVLLRALAAGDVRRGEAGLGRHVAEVDGDGGKAGLDGLDASRGTMGAHPLIGLEKGAATEQQGEAERDAR